MIKGLLIGDGCRCCHEYLRGRLRADYRQRLAGVSYSPLPTLATERD
jgi:hypothetical protein